MALKIYQYNGLPRARVNEQELRSSASCCEAWHLRPSATLLDLRRASFGSRARPHGTAATAAPAKLPSSTPRAPCAKTARGNLGECSRVRSTRSPWVADPIGAGRGVCGAASSHGWLSCKGAILFFRAIDGGGLLTAESYRGGATSAVVDSFRDGQGKTSAW